MQKFLYTALFTMGVFAMVASPVSATVLGEQSQEQKATQEINCETTVTGSYGSDVNVKCNGTQTVEQKQYQKILGDQVVVKEGQRIHYPVDTALDETTMAAAIGLAVIGGMAYVAKRKLT